MSRGKPRPCILIPCTLVVIFDGICTGTSVVLLDGPVWGIRYRYWYQYRYQNQKPGMVPRNVILFRDQSVRILRAQRLKLNKTCRVGAAAARYTPSPPIPFPAHPSAHPTAAPAPCLHPDLLSAGQPLSRSQLWPTSPTFQNPVVNSGSDLRASARKGNDLLLAPSPRPPVFFCSLVTPSKTAIFSPSRVKSTSEAARCPGEPSENSIGGMTTEELQWTPGQYKPHPEVLYRECS